MRIACTADLHGNLPILDSSTFDILLIAGDITPHPARDWGFQRRWLDTKFRRWLDRLGRPVYATWGNHDLVGQDRPDMVPEDLSWILLVDRSIWLPNGMKLYGSPWQPTFPRPGMWAYNADEPELCQHWAAIPDDTDVLLLHGPPHGIGDLSSHGGVHTGSPGLTSRIEDVRPRLVCCGHIHEGYGRYWHGDTMVVNAAHVDLRYRAVNPVVVVEV